MTGEPRASVLVVDDEEIVRTAHARLVEALGLSAEVAADGVEAISKLVFPVDLVLLDAQMPNMDGFDVARRIRSMPEHRYLPIIIVSGLDSPGDVQRAFEAGANDFLEKPISSELLGVRTQWLLDATRSRQRLEEEVGELNRQVSDASERLRTTVDQLTRASRKVYGAHLDAIRRLTIAAEYKDELTAGHIDRIGSYSEIVATALGWSPGEIETIRHAAPLHDVGKLAVPDEILLKPDALDPIETVIMRKHAQMGAELLAGSESEIIQMGEAIARSHHERWDGDGYPQGLAGEDIPAPARICAVVDCFDAMTMDRPYRDALPVDQSIEEMREESGRQFDPKMLAAFLDCLPEILQARARFTAEGAREAAE